MVKKEAEANRLLPNAVPYRYRFATYRKKDTSKHIFYQKTQIKNERKVIEDLHPDNIIEEFLTNVHRWNPLKNATVQIRSV